MPSPRPSRFAYPNWSGYSSLQQFLAIVICTLNYPHCSRDRARAQSIYNGRSRFVCRPVARPQSAADAWAKRGRNQGLESAAQIASSLPPLRANRNRARINHFQCIRPSPRPVAFYIIYFLSFSSDVSRRRRRCLFYFSKIIESVCLYFSARCGIYCWLSLVKSREGEE